MLILKNKYHRLLLALSCAAGLLLAGLLLAEPVREAFAPAAGTPLPVIMYHSVLRDPARTGAYVVTPDSIRQDMEWLRENGYAAVSIEALTAYIFEGAELPERPVLLTFDDGYLNNMTYLPELMAEYDMCAVIFAVGEYAERYTELNDPNPNYAYMTWTDLEELAADPHFEIGSHTYGLHSLKPRRGSGRLRSETRGQWESVFREDVGRMREALGELGITTPAFAYPFGIVSEGADELLAAMGYKCTFTCAEEINLLAPGDAGSLLGMGRFNRDGGMSTEEFMAKIFR